MAGPRKWKREFLFDNASSPQPSRRIGPQLVPLMRLPQALVGHTARPEFSSLSSRDLYRGHAVDLPCGEAVARALGEKPCNANELFTASSELSGARPCGSRFWPKPKHAQGRIPGHGGRTDCGRGHLPTLRHDPDSFLNYPKWKREFADDNVAFGIAHFLTCAAVA